MLGYVWHLGVLVSLGLLCSLPTWFCSCWRLLFAGLITLDGILDLMRCFCRLVVVVRVEILQVLIFDCLLGLLLWTL